MSKLLVLAETNSAHVLPSTLSTIAFAQAYVQETGGGFDLLLVGGPAIANAAEPWRGWGAERVFVVAAPELARPTADRVGQVCADALRQSGANALAGPASAWGRDVLPRIAGLLNLPMVSDVSHVEMSHNHLTFQHPIHAGSVTATVRIEGGTGAVFSVRGAAFDPPEPAGEQSRVEMLTIDAAALPQQTRWIGLEAGERKRPELTAARVVVCGGRALQNAATFEHLVGGLADKLGGAVGASGGAVYGGIADSDLQIGQTGKTVAPDLYIGAGISGSDQHLAGMKDSRVIVAINTDADTPLFQIADYGLVADLHQALPELIEKL